MFPFIWNVKKVINFLSTQKFTSNTCIKKLNLRITSALRACDICFLDIVYLIKHSSANIFHFVFIQKKTKNKHLRVYHHIDLYLDKMKE